MRHALRIVVSKDSGGEGVVACRHLTMREKLLRFLMGSPVKLTVLVPGDHVDEVEISKARTGGGA